MPELLDHQGLVGRALAYIAMMHTQGLQRAENGRQRPVREAVDEHHHDHRIMRSGARRQLSSQQGPEQQPGVQRAQQRRPDKAGDQRSGFTLALTQTAQYRSLPQHGNAQQYGAGQQQALIDDRIVRHQPVRRDRPQIEPAEQQRQVQGAVGQQGHAHAPQPRAITGA